MNDPKDFKLFCELIDKYRYDFDKLVYIIFPFGEKGTELEGMAPYQWQINIWKEMSAHFKDPAKRDIPFKLAVSSGNGIGKSAFFSITLLMLMYTQKLRGRITANTYNQIKNITWVEIDNWCRRARYFGTMFEKLGESIKSKDEKLSEVWRTDVFTWDENNPASVSGLHNKHGCIFLGVDEAAGLPDTILKYMNGAMSDTETMKVWIMIGNSDDPDSAFEQKMQDASWISKRIDSRTVENVSKSFIDSVLKECNGNEDADDFRVRVRGLPRKSASDSIISYQRVKDALESGKTFDITTQDALPCVMTVDPAWLGGDFTTIWIHQGSHSILVEKYKLSKEAGTTHIYTYQRMLQLEKEYRVDHVLIDQGEGTAVYSMAQAQQKYNWELVSFAGSPNDKPDPKESIYHNIRAQMYYEAEKWLQNGGTISSKNPEWIDDIQKQLCWTKGMRNRITLKKQAEPKDDIRKRVNGSPDVADGFVLRFSRVIYDRLPENIPAERDVYELDQGEIEYDPYKGM